MALFEDDLSSTKALVADGNPTSRAILVTQLREFGVGSVVQCSRAVDARRHLEYKKFDIVLCEHHFENDSISGQDLLDDLRRNQLLPFSTVFIMVTAEATYAKVAEAAESALDGYLLKPHTASNLADRLRQARHRKLSLQEIFVPIEAEDYEAAAALCMKRFESRGQYWLYAARIGAELLMRLEKYAQAQTLYEAVVAAKTLPWAKLGVARSLLDSGEPTRAISTLENLISEDPNYADAYDVLGRVQVELGRFDLALETYKMACDLTPASITRLQNLGMMSYYSGDRAEAEKILGKAARLGLDSKMFDCQTLVLLAFARLELNDRKGLLHCRDDFMKLLERNPDSTRLQRMLVIVDALILIMDRQFGKSLDTIRAIFDKIKTSDFDFESATNLMALLGQLADKAIRLDEVETVVDTLGMRFCTSRSVSELMAGATAIHPPYAERIRACNAQVLRYTENALSLSMNGDPSAAVKDLLVHGSETLNAKLVETAYLVLQRYTDQIDDREQLRAVVLDMRNRLGPVNSRPTLGEQKRQPGGLTLRTKIRSPATSPAPLSP